MNSSFSHSSAGATECSRGRQPTERRLVNVHEAPQGRPIAAFVSPLRGRRSIFATASVGLRPRLYSAAAARLHETLAALVFFACLMATTALAQPKSAAKPVTAAQPIREIYVPFEDLNVILDNDKHRVFLTREEYEALVEQAKSKPQTPAPHKVVLVTAQYEGQLEDGRALITGELTIDVLEEGLFALPLEIGGVGIRSALLDGKPAPLTRHKSPHPQLLVQGQGTHKLELKLTAPLQTAAAQQTLQIALPSNAATRLKLTVPGNVEVKGGAAVRSRSFDMAANQTVLELLPQHGGMAIVMSLNNRLLQEQRVIVARSVIVDEVTQGYERIHATVSYRVLHGAVEKLRLAVPAGFEVTSVESVQLARWEAKPADDGRQTLEAILREPTSEQIVLRLTANRSPDATSNWLEKLQDWNFPKLEPLDTAGNVAVVGLVVEDRLRPERIETEGLLPIDVAALTGAIPASVLQAEPGAPLVRQVASFYAPASDYKLTASFMRPPAGLKVAANSLLVIGNQGLTLQGGFALTPQAESLFAFDFVAPAGWKVTQVTAADGTPLPVERYEIEGNGTRIAVRLAKGISIGQTQTVNYQAQHTPAGWLAEWQSQQVEFPKFVVEDATSDSGALAAQAVDDIVVRPEELTNLTPLLENEKAAFGLANIPTALAYRFEKRDFSLALAIERTAPSIAAQVYSFLKIERDNLVGHYVLHYDVREARTRQVAFSLPLNTPAEIAIAGLEGTTVKEQNSREENGRRLWTVQLAERQIGAVRLAVDFTQRLPETAQRNAPLPLALAEEVEYQSGFVAVEGDAELDVSVTTDAATREVDVGELSGANHPIGRRVLGSFGYVGREAQVKATITLRDPYTLPPALVQRAELVTKVSAAGQAQSIVRYDLLTKATLLEIRLPAGSELWSIYLDGQPTKPQREKESLLLSLPAQQTLAMRKLQIVYASPSHALRLSGTVEAVAPQLLVRAKGTDAEREVPQADLEWQLLLPTGYVVRRAEGTVETDEIEREERAAVKVGRWLYAWAGGIRPWSARSMSARQWKEAVELAGQVKSHSSTILSDESAAMPSATPAPASAMPAPPAAPAVDFAEDALTAGRPMKGALRRQVDEMRDPQARAALQLDARKQVVEELRARTEGDQAGREAALGQLARRAGDEIQLRREEGEKKSLWALEGVSSIQIDFQADAPATTFRSLGEDPRLAAVVIDQRRIDAAGWGLSLLVGLVGVGLTFSSTRRKAAYVVVVLLAAMLPLLVTTAFDEVAQVFDYVFFAGCWLIAWYLAAALALAVFGWARRLFTSLYSPAPLPQVAVLLAGFALMLGTNVANAQLPPWMIEDTTPVAVPADAIVVPYDPERPIAAAPGEKLLVPYAKYIELWNQAHPDKKIETTAPPVQFAIAGAAYEASLAAGDYLAVVGKLEIDVYSDKPIAVPLALAGGVIESATVDGEAARLQLDEVQLSRPVPQAALAASNRSPAALPRMIFLHLAGKGRKSVELHIRLGLARQGGWRIVRAKLPASPAAALTLSVPEAGTEIRQTSLADRGSFETKAANEKIETALGPAGALDLQWRPKVAEGMVDQALTARSLAVFDVREDSLRMTWQLRLEFGRAFRDSFSLSVPSAYLVEGVTGDNVRAWTAKKEGDKQRIDVTLLKPVQGGETLTVQLSQRGRIGHDELTEFDAPAVLVEGAALEQGEIAVRRSPRLELRTLAATGLTRADSGGQTQAVAQLADAADAAVLLVRPHQTFRFVRPPFHLTLAASELPEEATAELKAALRVAERDTTLDAELTIRPKGQPLYRVRLYLPDGFTLDRLGPGDLEWAVTTEDDRQLLTVQLLNGRTEEFKLTLLGKITVAAEDQAGTRTLAVPKIEILDMQKQEGEIFILPDPDTDVRLDNLQNCEGAPVTGGAAWMKAEQRPLAKAVVRYHSVDYAATLRLTPRTPLVSVRTITNVKITPTMIAETVLLDFRIEQAGIRSVAFLLPQHLAKARLKPHPLLKQKTVEPATTADGQPIAGMVRMTLELQDYVRGEFVVLLELDRLLTSAKQTVSLPVVETGRTIRRLVAIENSGRDEVVVSDLAGLEAINRQQQAWRELTAVLGDRVTQAYVAADNANQPTLAFSTLQRQQAERAGARIDLATTVMVVDSAGTYRAIVQYNVTNSTEQFLQLSLPEGARLWTAIVDGEPVKPAVPGLAPVETPTGTVRIPLVRKAEGDGDYPVELKYGGQMKSAGLFGSVSFPLIRETSINVERSIVRLLLPESRQWFDFRGTLGKPQGESKIAEVFQSYLNKRIQDAKQALSSANDYSQVRAAVNLKQSQLMFERSRRTMAANNLTNLGDAFENLEMRNSTLLSDADEQAREQFAKQRGEATDNRERLNSYYLRQDVQRSKNVVSDLGSNFDVDADKSGGGLVGKAGEGFNSAWFDQNKLKSDGKDAAKQEGKPGEPEVAKEAKANARYLRGGTPLTADQPPQPGEQHSAQKAPGIAAGEQLNELQKKLSDEVEELSRGRRGGDERAQQLDNYARNLELNAAPQLQGQAQQGQQPQTEYGFQLGAAVPQPGFAEDRGGQMQGGGAGFGGGMPASGGVAGRVGGYGLPGLNAPAGGPMPAAEPFGSRAGTTQSTDGLALAFDAERLDQVAAGLASLDVAIPQRGRMYRFTTPRGDLEITARAIPVTAISRLWGLAAVLLAVCLIGALNSRPARRLWALLASSTVVGIALVVLGLVSVAIGVFPVAGLLMVAGGIAIAIRSRVVQSPAPAFVV